MFLLFYFVVSDDVVVKNIIIWFMVDFFSIFYGFIKVCIKYYVDMGIFCFSI